MAAPTWRWTQGFSVELVGAADLEADPIAGERLQFKQEDLYFCRKAPSAPC